MLDKLKKKKLLESLKESGSREPAQEHDKTLNDFAFVRYSKKEKEEENELGPGYSRKEVDKDYYKEDITLSGDQLGKTSTRNLSEEEADEYEEELKKKKKR